MDRTRSVLFVAGLLMIASFAVAGCNGDDDDDEEDTGLEDVREMDVADVDAEPDTAQDTAEDTAEDVDDADDADAVTPSVTVEDQTLADPGQVTVPEAVSPGPGWMVIHEEASEDEAPGDVIGWVALESGTNTEVTVDLDRDAEDGETLYAMLHHDTGEVGAYEFGEGGGEDGPVQDAEGNVVVEPFEVTLE